MLLYKGWLETRFRLVVALILGLLYCGLVAAAPTPANGQIPGAAGILAISATLMTVMLAGAGIATQSAMISSKGLHGSTLYTLSLPVRRVRILAVRAGLGWLEMAAGVAVMSGVMWLIDPPLRSAVTPLEVAAYALTLIACTSGLYAITVFLSTFLDDVWRIFGSFISLAVLWFLATRIRIPDFLNVFKAATMGSPLVAHSMPWGAIVTSLLFTVVLILAAIKVAQLREYLGNGNVTAD